MVFMFPLKNSARKGLIFHSSCCTHDISTRDPSHKFQNTVDKYPTMHHFVQCIVGHGAGAFLGFAKQLY